MCVAVFLWLAHPIYDFFLLHNRDEYHNRPTEPSGWWKDREILGGRDGSAGGTWLACSKNGKVAFVTNVREISNVDRPKSRGDLPVRFMESKKSPAEFAEEVVKDMDQYNGFNLILVDVCCKSMIYVTNRPREGEGFTTLVSPGIHVLSNASLDTPWPKAVRLSCGFENLLERYGASEFPIQEMADKLMTDTTKADKTMRPGVYTPEWEYLLSSVFVEADSPLGLYGTRSISGLAVKTNGEVSFYERYLEEDWKEHIVNFIMEQRTIG